MVVAPKSQYPRQLAVLAEQLNIPQFPELIRRFLYDQLYPDAPMPASNVDLNHCPTLRTRIYICPSAVAMFYAPSDPSGIGGMYCERIRATPSWHGGPPRNDCVFLTKDSEAEGMRGLHVVRIRFFFKFTHNAEQYPCALVQWFSTTNEPCEDTTMWIVQPDIDHYGRPVETVVHVDCIVRGALLIPVYGSEFLPPHVNFSNSLGLFKAYFVNKYADHHAHEIAF